MARGGTLKGKPSGITVSQREAIRIARDIFYGEMTGYRVRQLTMKLYEMALDGDLAAMKMILDRVIPTADRLAAANDNSVTINAINLDPQAWQTPEWLAQRNARRQALLAAGAAPPIAETDSAELFE
jgi:hypothetical protein